MTWLDRISEVWARLTDMIKRVTLTATSDPLRWTVEGYDAEDVDAAELFPGIGFAARPPDGANAEAIVCNVGGRDHPVIVATRDGDTAAAIAGGLAPDESLAYTTGLIVKLTATGEIELRAKDGTAQALALLQDALNINARVAALEAAVNALIALYNLHTHPVSGSTATATTNQATPAATSAAVNGTTVVRGQ